MIVWAQAVAMALVPWLAARQVSRLQSGGWGAFLWGWLSFVLSQLVHIPLLLVMLPLLKVLPVSLSILVLCALAGLCEEPARYLVLGWRYPAPSMHRALMLGLGHSACEALCLAVLLLPGTLIGWLFPQSWLGVLAGVPLVWRLAAVLERGLATVVHAACGVLVGRSLGERQAEPLVQAILLHSSFNLAVVWTYVNYGLLTAEALGLMLALLLLIWLQGLWGAQKVNGR